MFFAAGEFAVYVDGRRCCTEADRLWVCERNEHI